LSTNDGSEGEDIKTYESSGSYSKRQQFFLSFNFSVLVDLTVLNLFSEYWDNVYVEPFTTSLLAAILLQTLMRVTIVIEHYVAGFFNKKPGVWSKVLRFFSAWTILFISKLAILWVINMLFGSSVLFSGMWHGVVAFILVVITMIIAEQIFIRAYRALA